MTPAFNNRARADSIRTSTNASGTGQYLTTSKKADLNNAMNHTLNSHGLNLTEAVSQSAKK